MFTTFTSGKRHDEVCEWRLLTVGGFRGDGREEPIEVSGAAISFPRQL